MNDRPVHERALTSTKEELKQDTVRISAELAGFDEGTDPFAAIARATRVPMIITNPRKSDSPIVFANDASCRLSGYAQVEVLDRNCRFLQGLKTDLSMIGRLRKALKAVETAEMDICNHCKDGEPFWNRLLMAPVHDANGTLAYFFVSLVDITIDRERLTDLERRNAALMAELADRLHEHQEIGARLRLLSDNVIDLVSEVDWAGTQKYVSQSSEKLLGQPAPHLLGRHWCEFVHPDHQEQLASVLAKLRKGETPDALPYQVQHQDGTWRHFDAYIRALPDGSGAIVVARDIIARARTEKHIRQGHRIEAVGRLTAGVAHDFNNVLQALLGNLELVIDEVADRPDLWADLELTLEAGQRGARLTSHLLSFSRQQVLRPAALELVPFIRKLARALERTLGYHVVIHTKIAPNLPHVLADAAHLDSTLLNLAINARDAMQQGGELQIEAYAAGGRVVIAVTDMGEGMTRDVTAHACEPFFSTKGVKGSGLGLSMVQGFARQSGGELRIQSLPGQSTRVEIWLPTTPAPNVMPVVAAKSQQLRGQSRILVVDDDPGVGRVTTAFLRKAGLEVTTVGGGNEALTSLGVASTFDVLVTDDAMPGMNGSNLVLCARELHPLLPALIITGYAGAKGLDDLPSNVTVLRKPFQREDLVSKVKNLIDNIAQLATSFKAIIGLIMNNIKHAEFCSTEKQG